MVRLGRQHKGGSVFDPGHKRPPNYFARSTQVKILMLVFLFLGVLWMMGEARKPENWRWMWQLDGNSTGEQPARDAPIDTRPPLEPAEPDNDEPVVTATQKPSLPDPTDRQPAIKVQLDGWNRVLRRLSKDQRQVFQNAMWSWRRKRPLSEQAKAAWTKLLPRLDDKWTDYHTRAYVSVAQDGDHLTDAQKRESIAVIETSKSLWEVRKGALAALGQDQQIAPAQSEALRGLQQILDQRAWAQVEDNSILRSAETEAWNRCWEMLESLTPQQLVDASGPLNFVQLFSQPSELRGQLVKVIGTARWAYRVKSREPRFGIDAYYVVGLLPSDGSSSPIVLYSAELPDGFPDIRPADSTGKGMPLNEDVEVTGYFFKRWLHRSEGGMNLSPLILGKVTAWQSSTAVDEQTARGPLTALAVLYCSIALALLGAAIAFWVYHSGQWSSIDAAESTQIPQSLPAFDQDPVHGNISETLRKFAGEE